MLKTFTTAGVCRVALLAGSGLAALASSGAAFAQTDASTVEAQCPDADNNGVCDTPAANADGTTASTPGSEGAIVVTGSRLRRDGFNSPDPIQVVTREETTQAGFNSAAEALQSTQVTSGQGQINNAFGGFVTAGGPGANTLSLRGLGASRTLVLLNGRRIAPAGTRGQVGAADLNVLPSAVVERFEVLYGGASSIYGSDAIAGVVNIISRPNIDGLYLEAQHNVPQVGAGMSGRYSAVFGYNNDRFNIAGSVEYYKREALKIGDVDWTACQTSYRKSGAGAAPGTGDFIDPVTGQPKCYPTGATGESGTTVNTIGTPNINPTLVNLAPGVIAGYGTLPTSAGFGAAPTSLVIGGPGNTQQICNRFRPDPTAGGILPGFECVGGNQLSLQIRDTFPRSVLNNDLISPAEVYTGYLQAGYELQALGNAELYTEILVNRRKSSQLQSRQFTIDYPFNSPLIPTLLRFPVRFLPPQATNPGVDVGVRVFADYGNYENRQEVDFVRALAGLRGDLFADWRYDIYAMKSWADATYETDLILTDRLNQSLDVVASGSGFACRVATRGCVAAPALTPAVVGGQFPQDWFNFVVQPVIGTTKYRETTFAGNFDGPLVDLWDGTVQVALGAEYRKVSIDDTPSIESQTGNLYNFTGSAPTRGEDSVWEVFGEIEIPLLRDRPFFDDLTITASARYTEYESYGGQETYKIGGKYSPVNWVSFRGSYGTSFRAPALFEQFLGATSGFQSNQSDPCNNLNASSNPVRVANCASEGIGLGFIPTTSITVLQRGGAESGLQAETSTNWTVGAVVEPSLGDFGRLSLSADYFNIQVENGVQQLGFGTILSQCYDDPDFRSESICSLVVRNPSAPFGLTVTTGYVNISESIAKGWDFNARYTLPIGSATLRINADVTKLNDRYTQNLPTDPISDNIGTINNPEWTGDFSANLRWDRWDFNYGVEWLDATNSPASYLGVSQAVRDTYVFETDDYFLHRASIRWRGDDFTMILGVRNLFDTDPPFISSGAYNRVGNAPLYSGYDYAGRTFFINVSTKL
jgi:iron complex outermembrane recepter protein